MQYIQLPIDLISMVTMLRRRMKSYFNRTMLEHLNIHH